MIETAIYILIGALASALAFLLVLPAVSARAARLAQRRAALTAPLSEKEARADRDALRGRHAVEMTLVERRVAKAEVEAAEAQIVIGRQAATLASHEAALKVKGGEIAAQTQALAAAAAELRHAGAEIGAREVALLDAFTQRDVAARVAAAAAANATGLSAAHDPLRGQLAQARSEFAMALAEADDRIAELRRRLTAADAAAATAPEPGAIEGLRTQLGEAATRENQLDARVQALAATHGETEGALRGARAERDALAQEISTLRDALKRQESLGDGDALLRQAIARIGREMVEAPSFARTRRNETAPNEVAPAP